MDGFKMCGGDGFDYIAQVYSVLQTCTPMTQANRIECIISVIKGIYQMANNMRPPEAWYNPYKSGSSSMSEETLPRSAERNTESMQSVTVSVGIDDSSVMSN